jgi:Flp pilus assembly protein CpaB
MRASRVILIVFLIVILVGVGAYVALSGLGGGDEAATPGSEETAAEETVGQEPGLSPPTEAPEFDYTPVVVALTDIPVGTQLTEDLMEVVLRPNTNTAVVAGVTFAEENALVGQFARNEIAEGQEILSPMLALRASELGAFGSDLSLYVNDGNVAVAFPIDRFSGLAYAMRPGDRIDIMMSLSLVQIDPEFRTRLPNLTQRVDQAALLEGQSFLFPSATQGRLELVPAINLVGEIAPGGDAIQQPRRVTQLTIQQAQVVWVGTWEPKREEPPAPEPADGAPPTEGEDAPTPQPTPQAVLPPPDVVILSLPAQDALALKWAQESGISVRLALRAQGDDSTFTTSAVSLPERVERGGMTIPETGDFDLEPRFDRAPIPYLPPSPPIP